MVLNVEDLGIFAPPLGLTPGVLASGMYRLPVVAGNQAKGARIKVASATIRTTDEEF